MSTKYFFHGPGVPVSVRLSLSRSFSKWRSIYVGYKNRYYIKIVEVRESDDATVFVFQRGLTYVSLTPYSKAK